MLHVNRNMEIRGAERNAITPRSFMDYLGCRIGADPSGTSEINSRLGRAWAEFAKLERLWKHSTLPPKRKLEIFQAAIVTGLMYGLAASWLNTRQQRQLNGFQARCLRRILRIPPSWLSRISNKQVLDQAHQYPLTHQLHRQQLLLFGRIARAPDSDLRRRLTFCPGSMRPATDRYVRRVGRPRLEWAAQIMRLADAVWTGHGQLERLIGNETIWRTEVLKAFPTST